jgi:hypothetical protein
MLLGVTASTVTEIKLITVVLDFASFAKSFAANEAESSDSSRQCQVYDQVPNIQKKKRKKKRRKKQGKKH